MNKFILSVIACVALAFTSCSSPAEDIIEENTESVDTVTAVVSGKYYSESYYTPGGTQYEEYEFTPNSPATGTLTIRYYCGDTSYELKYYYHITDTQLCLGWESCGEMKYANIGVLSANQDEIVLYWNNEDYKEVLTKAKQ